MKISVVIPAYNEKDRLPPTLAEIENFMQEYPGVIDDVVVVDDGSKDVTMERAMRYIRRLPLKLEAFAENRGKWAAIRRGIDLAKNDCILLLDADGSASINELAKTKNLSAFYEGKLAIFGSRFTEGATVDGKPMVRSIISSGYRAYVLTLYKWATGKSDVDDMQCPMKLFKKSYLQFPLTVERFSGDIELASSLSVKVVNHPVQFLHKGGSAIKASTVWEMARETFKIARQCKKQIGLQKSLLSSAN